MNVASLTLTRCVNGKFGAFGCLTWGASPMCVTLERPWLDNQRNVSCIPAGTYRCTKYRSEKFDDCVYVHDVPGRDGILIHAGNVIADTEGCILVGKSFSPAGILKSRQALSDLLVLLPSTFNLTIKDA